MVVVDAAITGLEGSRTGIDKEVVALQKTMSSIVSILRDNIRLLKDIAERSRRIA